MTEFSLPDVSKYLDLSSLHLLATTNQPPSVAEAVHIRDLLPGAEKALVCVETTIERLKEQLERAETARVQLQHAIAVYKTVTSPIRRLPNELISEIIDFAHSDKIKVIPTGDHSPWVLGHICSQWRAVLTCHRVWARIYLHSPICLHSASAMVIHPSDQVVILKEILRRSGNHLLDIELVFGHISSSYQHLLEEILTTCSRWKRLSLYTEDSRGTFDLLNEKHGQFPELQHLSLCINNYFCDRKLTAFHSIPALYDLELTSFHNERLLECIPLPWSQIRNLKVTRDDGEALSSILSLCSSLETLRCYDGTVDSHSPYLVLPSLKCLEIQQGSILRAFSFPALESLSFTHIVEEYDLDPDALSALAYFTRQPCSLKYLCLDLDVDDRLVDILRNCHHLESFHFQPRDMEMRHFENLMHHMSRQQNVTSLLPHLRELSIDMSKHEYASWKCFVEMLSSRWRSPDDQLLSIRFLARSRQSFGEDELSLLQEYKENGLDVQVITDGIQVL